MLPVAWSPQPRQSTQRSLCPARSAHVQPGCQAHPGGGVQEQLSHQEGVSPQISRYVRQSLAYLAGMVVRQQRARSCASWHRARRAGPAGQRVVPELLAKRALRQTAAGTLTGRRMQQEREPAALLDQGVPRCAWEQRRRKKSMPTLIPSCCASAKRCCQFLPHLGRRPAGQQSASMQELAERSMAQARATWRQTWDET